MAHFEKFSFCRGGNLWLDFDALIKGSTEIFYTLMHIGAVSGLRQLFGTKSL